MRFIGASFFIALFRSRWALVVVDTVSKAHAIHRLDPWADAQTDSVCGLGIKLN